MLSLHKLKTYFIQEITPRLPWAFVAYTCGIAFFFGTDVHINLWISFLFLLIFGLFLFWMRHKLITSWTLILLFFFILGMVNSGFHTRISKHPVLSVPLYQTPITATVLENQFSPEKQTLTLGKIQWQTPDLKMPTKIRVSFHNEAQLNVGDRIKAVVSVYPPNSYTMFSDMSFFYRLWFNKIGAIGKAEKVEILKSENPPLFASIRHYIRERLFFILPRSQAEIAVPLITGEQKLIPPSTYQIFKRTGIAHVLSVSGFHMALLATFLFFLIRSLCVLFPKVVFYWNSKKIAAITALFGTFLYLVLSGFQVPALRAFIMITLVFLGVLIDRSVISMRSLLIAGFAILFVAPHFLLGISFQLSFIAVAVLAKICQMIQNKPWNKTTKMITGFISLNVFVYLALVPFIAYHFNQFMPYGILGSMLFSSIFSLFIMPLLFMGCLLIPVGWDFPFFYLAGKGIQAVLWGCTKLSHLPNVEITIPSFPGIVLFCVALGIMLFCFMKTSLKKMAFFVWCIGLFFYFITPNPVLLIQDKTIAFKKEKTLFVNPSADGWLTEIWRQKWGCDKVSVFKGEKIDIQGVHIALKPNYCKISQLALLSVPAPNQCPISTIILEKKKAWKIFVKGKKFFIKRVDALNTP